MSPTTVGLFVGLLLALIGAIGGLDSFLLAALLGAVGLVVGRVITGKLDLTRYLGGSGRDQR